MTSTPIEQDLVALMHKYRSKGILTTGIGGSELLLHPSEALSLLADLETLGVAVWGVDCYHYADPVTGRGIVEEIGADFEVDDMMMSGNNAIAMSIDAAINFILHDLPQTTTLVSLYLEEKYTSIDLFPDVPRPVVKE